jgi:hypothetical protein
MAQQRSRNVPDCGLSWFFHYPDWAEAFTALNLVLAPTLDDVLLTQLGQVARAHGDEETWLLTSYPAADVAAHARAARDGFLGGLLESAAV